MNLLVRRYASFVLQRQADFGAVVRRQKVLHMSGTGGMRRMHSRHFQKLLGLSLSRSPLTLRHSTAQLPPDTAQLISLPLSSPEQTLRNRGAIWPRPAPNKASAANFAKVSPARRRRGNHEDRQMSANGVQNHSAFTP